MLILGNINWFYVGIVIGWAAPNFILLTSDESPIESGPLSIAEGSLVVSILYLGGLFGVPLAIFAAERFGRKIPLLLLSIPQIVRNFSNDLIV